MGINNVELLQSKKYYMLVPDNARGKQVKAVFDAGLKKLYDEKYIEKLYSERGFTTPNFY